MAAELMLGAALGALGALVHLQATRYRARLVGQGRVLAASSLLPLGFAGPVLSIYIGSRFGSSTAWFGAAFLVVTHQLALAGLRRRALADRHDGESTDLPS